jgi:glyoxylate/hydroxypyruvate reductase A
MRDDAILIHLGRGEHLNEEELCSALEAGRPGCAAIDVTKIEPPSPDHPFWGHSKIMMTPHIAALTSPRAVASWIGDAILQFERGEVPNGLVDRRRGY